MRYRDIINEIERYEKEIRPGDSIALGYGIQKEMVFKKSKKLPGNNPYNYSIIPGNNKYYVYITDPQHDEIIGSMTVNHADFPLRNAVRAKYVTVHQNYTGYGISKAMYGVVLSILRQPLLADDIQSNGGRRNWISLNRIPGVQVKGYIKINEYDLEDREDDSWQTMIGSIMNTGADYIGEDNAGSHYFAFDVESNNDLSELQAVYKQAVTLYHNNYQSLTTGLYAVWTGR